MGEIILMLHPREHETLKAILRLHIYDAEPLTRYDLVSFVHLCEKVGVELPDQD